MACPSTPAEQPALELADIFRAYGPIYRSRHRLPLHQRRAMWAIEHCRTAALGGHVDCCTHCDLRRFSYNSCGNRHCPKCQGAARQRWVAARQAELLPIEYFHVVFTLPHELNPLVRYNQRLLIGMLFRSASETLLAFGERHFKGRLGITAVLHTWGQNLSEHLHVHCVVTGGALSSEGTQWRMAPKGYLFPVRALSKVYRGKFCEALRGAYTRGALKLEGAVGDLQVRSRFEALVRQLYGRAWVVYAKRPFADAAAVVGYVGRYTHRVALSNRRLVAFDGESVQFLWKDYRRSRRDGTTPQQVMTLSVEEFTRRFLQHILPKGLMRIRHFGLLATRGRQERLARCRALLAEQLKCAPGGAPMPAETPAPAQLESWRICPSCEEGRLVRICLLPRGCGPPPAWHASGSNQWISRAA